MENNTPNSNLNSEVENLKKRIDQIHASIHEKELYLKKLEEKYAKLENKLMLQTDQKIYFKVSETTKRKLFDVKICIIWFGTWCNKTIENIIQERFFESNWLNSKNIRYIDTWTKEWRECSIKTVAKYDIIIIGQNDHILADMSMNSKNAIYDELIQTYKHNNVHVRTKNKKPYLNESKIKEMVFEWIRIINDSN